MSRWSPVVLTVECVCCHCSGGWWTCGWKETEKEELQVESVREISRRYHQRGARQHSVPQQRQDLGQRERESCQAFIHLVPWILLCCQPCVSSLCVHSPRAAHVTSADRRLWTPRQCVAVVSAWGPKVSSVGCAWGIATERTCALCCWTRSVMTCITNNSFPRMNVRSSKMQIVEYWLLIFS